MSVQHGHRVQRQGSFFLDLRPEDAFPLFTAEGERNWVPGWAPTFLGSAIQEPGHVFLTGTGRESTIWTVLESDACEMRHRYSRVTPGARAGIVEVTLAPEGKGSRAHVRYDLTALPDAGDDALAGYSEASFQAMLGEWRELIERWTASQRPAESQS